MRLHCAGDVGPPPLIEIDDSDDEFVECCWDEEEESCWDEEEEQVIAFNLPLGRMLDRGLRRM